MGAADAAANDAGTAAFPVDALPSWVADQVAAIAEFTQTPPDLAGCVALAALSTAAGGRATVEIRPGWREPLNIFTAVAMPPGSHKSAVFAAIRVRSQPMGYAGARHAAGPTDVALWTVVTGG